MAQGLTPGPWWLLCARSALAGGPTFHTKDSYRVPLKGSIRGPLKGSIGFRALRTHIIRLLGPKTILYKASGLV